MRVLNNLVHLNQSTFIPGRRISNNILLAHELVRGYHRDKVDCCALKVDFHKAYDSIFWDFLEEVLLSFRFPAFFTKLVMNAVRSCMYIMVNYQLEGYFSGRPGFSTKATRCEFLFHKNCGEMGLSHLCFADELFIFSSGDVASVVII